MAKKSDENSTTEVKNVNGSGRNVQTKVMVIRQKLDKETARWSRLMCDQFSRRAR